jgi:Ser/Thr protein kinase RdoA (MazF antagonist)
MLILDRLLKHGCKGVNYLKDLDGNFIHHIGDKIISLQPFILNSKTADKNIMVQEVASGLAQLHQVPFSDLPNRLSWFDPGVVKLSLEGVKTHKPDLHAKYIVAYDLVNVEKLEALPRSIIHGDISVANCLFDSDGNLLDFIDWEETMIAPAVFDLAMTIAAFCMEGNKFEPHLVTTALTSYQKERELSKNELQELSHAVYYVRLVLSLWFYNQFNIRTKSKEFSSLYKFFWEEEATLNEKVIDEVVEQVAKSLATA